MTGRMRRRLGRTGKLIQRHPGMSSAVAIVGLGLAAGLIVGLVLRSRSVGRSGGLTAVLDSAKSWVTPT